MKTKTPPFAVLGYFHSQTPTAAILAQTRGESLEEMNRRVEQMTQDVNRALEKAPSRNQGETFGDRLKKAVQRRLNGRGVQASASNDDGESFAEKLRKAVKKRSPAKQHEERVKRARERYRKPTQRLHTKSD
jgi:vacuolar-type H+-ATPase subunit E/Vma4